MALNLKYYFNDSLTSFYWYILIIFSEMYNPCPNSVFIEKHKINPDNYRILLKKNEYSHKVKVGRWSDWEYSKPFDADPLCPGNINHFRSHYNRFGTAEEKWITTTDENAKQVYLTKSLLKFNLDRDPDKVMLNIRTFLSDAWNTAPLPFRYGQQCQDFSTITQLSYQNPFVGMLSRISVENTEHENRFITAPTNLKFQDDGYMHHVKHLQNLRYDRHSSYNPCTCEYTNSNNKDLGSRKCVNPKY